MAANQTPQLEPVQNEGLTLQEQLSLATGLPIQGAIGGLPVAEQNQAYFAIFSEAGDTGPEIIDKTQFRISYLVDGDLNTSKPSSDGVSALNATQNFEKGKTVNVRADNATVLNQNLTGEKTIYNIGTIRLLCTTETGSSVGAYIPTMSFNNSEGQDIITDAQNLTGIFSAEDGQSATNFAWNEVSYANTVQAISQSNGTFEWIQFESSIYWELLQDTTVAGTRIYFEGNIFAQVEWDENDPYDSNLIGEIEIQKYQAGQWSTLNSNTFTINYGNTQYHYPLVSTQVWKNYLAGDRFRIRFRKIGPSYHILKVRDGRFNCKQEYTPGNVFIVGLNAITAPYFESTFSSFPGNDADNINSFSVLTSSAELGSFANGNYVVSLDPLCESFDPKNNGVTYNPIQSRFEFLAGDEIRFEYSKNKVHQIIKVAPTTSGKLVLWVTPQVDENTEVNHFTHYRITPDGGYLIANVIKNNDNNDYQPFNGIILPKYPSTTIQKREEKLIYDLKQANIIEN